MELENAPKDVFLYCSVRWLSNSDVLHRFLNLLKPIQNFLLEKKHFLQLENDELWHGFMVFTDVMKHLQTLNLALQEKIIRSFIFQNKIKLFQNDIMLRKFCHFPCLSKRITELTKKGLKDKKLIESKDKL